MIRVLAQRVLTGEWLAQDVPLADVEITWTLSGPTSLTGSIDPETARMVGDDGRPLFDEWGTWLHVEDAGQIRASGLVVFSRFRGPEWQIEAAGASTYPHGTSFLGVLRGVELDPLDVVRDVWVHLQGQPDGDLGVVVDTTTSPVRVGEQLFYTADFTDNAFGGDTRRWDRLTDEVLSDPPGDLNVMRRFAKQALPHVGTDIDFLLADFSWPSMSSFARRFNDYAADLFYARGNSFTTNNVETFLRDINQYVHLHEARPYELVWWESPDCGQEINQLARETPFDYRDEAEWNVDRTDVEHRLRLGYPRLGRRQHHLRFASGENITAVVEPDRDGDEFANEIIGVGKGEGSRMLRVRVPVRDGRLRRAHVLEDKTVGSQARMRALARDELHARSQLVEIPAVEVDAHHPNAPLGAFHAGDDILVRAEVDWLGDVEIWERITSMTYRPREGLVTMTLKRSDAFRYGASNG